MYTLRSTAKLLARLKTAPVLSPPKSSGLLGDWYANLYVMRRAHLVLAVSERTLLPVVVPARDIAGLPERIGLAVGEVLRTIGIREEQVTRELRQMNECVVAKTASRSVLGTMNDFAWMLQVESSEVKGLLDRSLLLAACPCSPIGMESPRRATLTLFAEQAETHLRLVH